MAKRTKKAKSSRSNLRVETLEQRQLLATIVAGSGTEVASNVPLNGGIYDQILMTGASVTVSADPGEVVRVSFLDQGGDIVQAEFAGKGTMTVSLEDVKTAASAGYTNKNPDQFLNGQKVNYIQGLATITVDKPELNTNLGVYAAGILQNPGFFTGQAKQGDNGLADIARVILVGNPNNEAGYSVMGGIRMGGATFSAATGVVGIRGENVAIMDIVAIGDIDAKESGVPTLMFNTNSQFQTVFVRGGDLRQTNGASFDSFGAGNGGAPGGSPGNGNNITLGGFSFFNSTDGSTSAGVKLWATPVNQAAIRLATVDQQTLMSGDWVYDWTNPQAVKVTQNGVDVSAVYGGDWLAKGGIQASLDYAFERRTFQGAITIKGDLGANYELNVADARSDVTFENNLYGRFTVDGFGASIDGTLTIKGNLDGAIIVQGLDRTGGFDGQQNKINAIVVNGSTGAFTDVRAEDIGNITIVGNMSGIFSTDVTRGNAWTPTSGAKTATGYVDIEGFIGNISVGYNAAGASTGGSIINGTFQGNSGIGNVKVGGDIYGTPQNQAVFETVSNAGAAPTDVRNYGSANIGSITVRGDVDLDSESSRLIFINGNGVYGDIKVDGLTTTNTVPGPQTGTKTDLIPGSESFVRILSPFTDVGFVPNASTGQKLVQNYDPDGVAGALNDTYFVTKADVAAGAQIYDIATGKMVAAKEGDRVPALSGGLPIIDTFGNVLYRQNTALFEGKTQTVPVFGPDVVTIVSGNRGNLNGVFNNFGRIEIAGLFGAQQKTTGSITWSDSVDMNFGGVTVNSSGNANQGVIGSMGTLGQITINNTSGATSDLIVSGLIGSANGAAAGNNAGTAFVGLTGITSGGFEDVRFGSYGGAVVHATEIKNGISVTTVAGSGNGTGVGTVSPSVLFDSMILLDDGTNEGTQKALLSINTGMVNSTIGFGSTGGITVDNGTTTGNGSEIDALSLSADYVYFNGTLRANKIGALTLTGGKGIGSASDTGVSFTGSIIGNTVGAVTGSASEGNVVFAPNQLTGIATKGTVNGITPMAAVSSITLTTAGTNNGGDILLGNGGIYNANIGDITLTAGHKLFLGQAGTVIDNPGNINVTLGTSGNVGNVSATTTTGNINNALTIQGNVGNITYTAGAAVVDKADQYAGAVGDLAKWGNISATQTIWGTRGVTTMETAGQKADGSAATLDFTVNNVAYKILPGGTIDATLNYAGASTATGDAFIAKTGGGNATVNYNVIFNDDNNDGVIASSEIGHGGNASVSSVSGDITFAGGTQLTDYTHFATLGNVALKTGTFAQASGLIGAGQKGDITLSFNDLAGGIATGGFEGAVGNITATTTAGNIAFGQSRFDGKVGNVTLTTGAVVHTGGVTAGNISTGGTGVTFNTGQGLVKSTATDVGTITATFNANGPQAATGNGFEFTSQYGAITATIGAGWYDANNNGLFTADEFGRTGDLAFTSSGGALNITLNSNKYVSDLEQSIIGNVTANNTSYIDVKNGATDTTNGSGTSALGSAIVGAGGNITITGANTQVGAVGNLVGNTTIGTITHNGQFGDLGTATFKTTSYSDADTNPNTTGEAAVLLASGNIRIGDGVFNDGLGDQLIVNGKHGLATYTVVEDGSILGSVTYGGAAVGADSLKADAVRGNISLDVWLQDADRDGSGQITASEYGTHGTTKVATTSGGDISLAFGTDQNNAAVLARNLVSQFTFGAVTATAADRYTSTSATAADVLADAGNITIIGAGADATNAAAFGPITGNRGNIESLTANTVRGNIAVTGNFGGLGDQTLTITRYADVNGANTNTFSGAINYSPSIWGTHGTAMLRTDGTGFVGTGTPAGGAISGVATFGGALASGKTVSVDAKTSRADINLDVIAQGYDLNGDGKITDGVTNNVPGDLEFAKVGNVIAETTNAGDITLGIGTATADGSKVGSSIGNVTVTANDDLYTAVANAADTAVNLANATVVGKSLLPLTAGTVGDISINVNTGNAGLTGNFVTIGGVSIATGTYTDASNAGGVSAVQAAGNIQLGTQVYGPATNADLATQTSLNIAGGFNDSTLTVTEMGTITGSVYVAGSGGKNWTLASNYGAINVGFVAGFDTDNADADNNSGTGTESGTIGNLVATSTYGNVTLGVGGRNSSSVIGNVSGTTGDKVTAVAEGADTFTSGAVTITGISGAGLGSVGTLNASVQTGVATLNGTFGGVAGANYTTNAYVDADTAAGAGEESVVIKSGDIALAAAIWGTHGTLNLTTLDSSKLAAGKSALPGTVGETGTITGTLAFSGGLASGVTDGIVTKTERGASSVTVTAGIDEDAANDQDSTDAGTVGGITSTSTDGNITWNLNIRNSTSSIGAVNLTTGITYQAKAEAADILISSGAIVVQSNNVGPNSQNYGTLGNVTATAGGGNIDFTGVWNNLGTVTLNGGRYVDADTAVGAGEPPATLAASDLFVNTTVRGTHNTFTLTAIDNSTSGAAFGAIGSVDARIAVTGSLAAGATKTLVATAQQGDVYSEIRALTYANIVDGVANIAVDDGTTNTDNRVGAVGVVELSSLFNDVSAYLETSAPVAKIAASDVVRTPSIGNVTASAGTSYSAVAEAADTVVSKGDIAVQYASLGSVGNLTATTGTGNIQIFGAASNVVGNIAATTGQYIDGDTAVGLGEPSVVLAAGSIAYSTAYAGAASTTIGTVTLQTSGSVTDAGVGAAGNITDTTSFNGIWTDAGTVGLVEAGEVRTITSGAYSATVTDGVLAYGSTSAAGFGTKMDSITLASTGTSTNGTTGDINITGGGTYSSVSNVLATATSGNVSFGATYQAPTISGVTLRSVNGNGATPAGSVAFSGGLLMDFANATNNRTTNVSISGVTLQADNGNVTLSGTIGENINYGLVNIAPTATTDNRTATITNVNLVASNGAADALAADGNVTISGLIGGADVTRVDQLGLVAGNTIDDKTTFASAGASNIQAWNIGKISTTGTAQFTNAGVANILADDSTTTRTRNGTVNYAVASTATTPGKGSVLNTIDELSFNGAVIGGANSLTTGATAEVKASVIGNITVNANVDPTSSTVYSVTNLDVIAAPQTGEFIAQNAGAAALSGYKTIDAFSIGNVTINHNLQGASFGSAVFSGSSAFVAGGKMGNITITSTVKGGVQAPMFGAGLNGNAWFNVGDINGTLNAANTAAAYAAITTSGAALVAIPTAKLSVGNVTVDVGSSYVPPAIQNGDIGNAGGGNGGGFAVAVGVDVNAAGNYFSAAAANAVLIDATRALHGSAGNVSISNAAIRPDNDVKGAAPTGTAAPGVVVVAGDGTAADDIADIVNELVPAGVVPVEDGEYYTVGDPNAGNDADANDVVVYVL